MSGYGLTGQDWSYLTARRALMVQSAAIDDPSEIPDECIIDTTRQRDGRQTRRARQQTLVLYVTLLDGAATAGLRLGVWLDSLWEETAIASPPDPEGVSDVNRWALLSNVGLTNEIDSRSQVFVLSWLPAGRYKAAVTAGLTSGSVVISEQHTE